MTDEELIARLRATRLYKGPDFNTPIADPLKVAAADRIAALTEQLAAARKDAEEAEAYAGELEKEREEARAAWEIEAATVKRFAERHTRHLVMGAEARDRAERAEAKLAKAVEALGTALSEMVDYADTHPAWSEIWEAREAARATLAELTGGKDE